MINSMWLISHTLKSSFLFHICSVAGRREDTMPLATKSSCAVSRADL